MAHFAKIENNIVTEVIVAEQDFVDNLDGTWIQTSYNTRGGKHYDPETNQEDDGTPLRKNYAGIGYTYDSTADVFYGPQPYPSWTLNTTTYLWDCPVAEPEDNNTLDELGHLIYYVWDEETLQWIRVD